jgi:hypothetical protein
MIRGNDENVPFKAFKAHSNNKPLNKFDFENKLKTKQSAFKVVSRVDKMKSGTTKRVFEIKKMSKVDLNKYNIDFRKDKSLVDKLFDFKESNYKGTRIVI